MRVFLASDHPEINKVIENLETEKGIKKLARLLACPEMEKWVKPLVIVDQAVYRERIIEKAKQANPDVVILYDKIPGMIDLGVILDELRLEVKTLGGKDTRVVFITSLEQGSNLLRKAVEIGIWDILSGIDIDILEIIKCIYQPKNYSEAARFKLASDQSNQVVYIPRYVEKEKIVEKKVEIVREKEVKVIEMVNTGNFKETLLVWSPFEAGKTTVAVNLAVALGKRGLKTILLEADIDNGTLDNYFDIKTEEKYALLLGLNTKMDPREILGKCHTFRKNLKVLCFPAGIRENPETEKSEIPSEDFFYLYDVLRCEADILIIDGSKDTQSSLTKAALKAASRVFVVNTLDPFRAKQTRIVLNSIGSKGIVLNKFEGVINMWVRTRINKNDIKKIMGLNFAPVDIPAVPELTYRSSFEGIPAYEIKGVAEIFAARINDLADYICGTDFPRHAKNRKEKRWFNLF